MEAPNHVFIQDLITSNRPPSDAERAHLQRLLDHSNDQLELVNRNIENLRREQATILEAISSYRTALSPFRDLPQDVLREIFIFCLSSSHNPTMSNKEAPMLLTQISSGLRQIALTTPQLWRAIHIPLAQRGPDELDTKSRDIMAKRAEGVKEWLLHRSGSQPLSISIHEPRSTYYASLRNNDVGHEIIDAVVACCSRWSDISLSCFAGSISRLGNLTMADVPLLSSMSLDTTHRNLQQWYPAGLLGAAHLKRLKIKYSVQNELSKLQVNWCNLTHLTFRGETLRNVEAYSITHVLRQTTNLVSCKVVVVKDEQLASTAGVDTTDITLPFLKNLAIDEPLRYPEDPIIHLLIAPRLQTLSYNTESTTPLASQPYHLMVPNLSRFMQRSTNIQRLSLGGGVSAFDLVDSLQYLPSLSHLYTQSIAFHEKYYASEVKYFLHRFSTNDEGRSICPQLHYFRCDSTLTVSLETLRSFIMNKDGTTPGLHCWKSVVMTIKYSDLHASQALEALVMEAGGMGIDLDFTQQGRPNISYSLNEGVDISELVEYN